MIYARSWGGREVIECGPVAPHAGRTGLLLSVEGSRCDRDRG
ncbi:hypothetical protein [Mycobacterium saskatchewanense]|nr:hypothetical protein [Mycobacterium saskatchewanense]